MQTMFYLAGLFILFNVLGGLTKPGQFKAAIDIAAIVLALSVLVHAFGYIALVLWRTS